LIGHPSAHVRRSGSAQLVSSSNNNRTATGGTDRMTLKELRDALAEYPDNAEVQVLVLAEDNEYHTIYGIRREGDTRDGRPVVLIQA
jgi:hypothetical protein